MGAGLVGAGWGFGACLLALVAALDAGPAFLAWPGGTRPGVGVGPGAAAGAADAICDVLAAITDVGDEAAAAWP